MLHVVEGYLVTDFLEQPIGLISRVKHSKTDKALNIGPVDGNDNCPETTVTHNQHTPLNILEERRTQLRRGVGVQSSIRMLFGPRREWSQYNSDRKMELSSKYNVKCLPSNRHGKVAEKKIKVFSVTTAILRSEIPVLELANLKKCCLTNCDIRRNSEIMLLTRSH
jgi:hypothetical protein